MTFCCDGRADGTGSRGNEVLLWGGYQAVTKRRRERTVNKWSGRRDLNSRPPPWQGGALPLSHFRSFHRRRQRPRQRLDLYYSKHWSRCDNTHGGPIARLICRAETCFGTGGQPSLLLPAGSVSQPGSLSGSVQTGRAGPDGHCDLVSPMYGLTHVAGLSPQGRSGIKWRQATHPAEGWPSGRWRRS